MIMVRTIKLILPFFILFTFSILLWRGLIFSKPNELPSPLIGKPCPQFNLPSLYQPQTIFSNKNLLGSVSLINIWATWCEACKLEMPMLLKIKHDYHIAIYGIDYKDQRSEALQWLAENGNPYTLVGMDKNGTTAIDFGVYGTPETYIVSKEGDIIYRHIGALDETTWQEILYPLIKQYNHES